MAKGKGEKGKKAKKEKVKETDPGADVGRLHHNYLQRCQSIGIEGKNDLISNFLLNEENLNRGYQILIGKQNDEKDEISSLSIGPGNCRALVEAILGQCQEGDSCVPFTALKDLRIWGSSIGNNGAAVISKLLRTSGGQLNYLQLRDVKIGIYGAHVLGRSLCRGVSSSSFLTKLESAVT